MLLSLPPELIIQTLYRLDLLDISRCKLVNRELNGLISSSVLLQYQVICELSGVVDNPKCILPYSDRLDALRKRERAWNTFTPNFVTSIDVHHEPCGIYDLTGGVYLLGDNNRQDLHYCTLPSAPGTDFTWTTINGCGIANDWPSQHSFIVDMGLSIYEHDLLVNVISSPIPATTMYAIELVLLKFSTGQKHPLARRPRIHIATAPAPHPGIGIEIVGDNLALVIMNRQHIFGLDGLFILNWKTGQIKLCHTARASYASLVFLSPTLLYVPNLSHCLIEIWCVPDSPLAAEEVTYPTFLGEPVPRDPTSRCYNEHHILSLRLPRIVPGFHLVAVSCRGEPNPYIHSLPHAPPKPFLLHSQDSIIVTNLRIAPWPGAPGSSFSMIIHRRKLFEVVEKYTSAFPLGASIPYLDVNPIDTSAPITGTISTRDNDSSHEQDYSEMTIPWSNWGPPVTWWLNTEEIPTRWITTSAGLRYVYLEQIEDEEWDDDDDDANMLGLQGSTTFKLVLLDFNEYAGDYGYSTLLSLDEDPGHWTEQEEGGDSYSTDSDEHTEDGDRTKEGDDIAEVEAMIKVEGERANIEVRGGEEGITVEFRAHGDVFAESVRMGLQFRRVIELPVPLRRCHGVLMDEERLLMLQTDLQHRIKRVSVYHFG